jgi:hypothetical protein
MFEVREVLRLWLAGEGVRAVARLAQLDRKTVRRYIDAAVAAGVVRDGGPEQLSDELLGTVVEAVRSQSPYEWERLLGLSARPVEVYCRVPIPVAAQRYAQRGASASHHAVHVARILPVEAFHEFQDPFGIGPVIELDTTRQVDIEALAAEVSFALRS